MRWGEAFTQSLQLNATPLVVAEHFPQTDGRPSARLDLHPATLAVQGKFHHYCAELGLGDPRFRLLAQPFDYGEQAVLYAPLGMPDPNAWNYTDTVVEGRLAGRQGGQGRRFLPRHQPARHAPHARTAESEDRGRRPGYPVAGAGRGQQERPAATLPQPRRVHPGRQPEFWEGVDVRGEALSLVVIDKIPFAPPDDPVLSARIEQMKREGRNAFIEYQLPRPSSTSSRAPAA